MCAGVRGWVFAGLVAVGLAAGTVSAGQAQPVGEAVSQVRPILLRSGEGVRGAFRQERQVEGFAKPLISEGHFSYSESEGMTWQTEKPFASSLVITDQGMTQYVNGQKTMALSSADQPGLRALFQVMAQALKGEWDQFQGRSDVQLVDSADGWRFVFRPSDGPAAQALQSLIVHGRQYVDGVEMVKTNGDRDVITFSDQSVVAIP
jgi:outer membrane lipoprotein-sorting protein